MVAVIQLAIALGSTVGGMLFDGSGYQSTFVAGVADSMFKALSDKGINIQVISTSEIKVSVLIAEEYTELALRALHTAYGLDAA